MSNIASDQECGRNPVKRDRALVSRPAGGSACKRYDDTSAHAAGTGLEIFCVTVGADGAEIATLTPVTGFTSSGLTGVALAAGEQIFGRWSTITLASGAVTVNECDAQA